jgi:hypothetical protein
MVAPPVQDEQLADNKRMYETLLQSQLLNVTDPHLVKGGILNTAQAEYLTWSNAENNFPGFNDDVEMQ